ncbi:MAG TPA: hypothetical protein VMR16_01050 [Candidatus Saccharimonadales bacterium]|nr:hypothetical protein [Candidatus Saccharimonadales bacterium]
MLNNYPNKTEKQHEHQKFAYQEYLDTSDEVFVNTTTSDSSADVEIEMASSIHDMRREFKRTVKDLRKLYKGKAPRKPAYEFETAKSARLHLTRSYAIG